jgi:hypothetical protein
MNRYFLRVLLSVLLCVGWATVEVNAQNAAADAHVANAKADGMPASTVGVAEGWENVGLTGPQSPNSRCSV